MDVVTTMRHCRLERQAWMRELGETVADIVSRDLESLNPETLERVSPHVIAEGLMDRLKGNSDCIHLIRRAHRCAVAEREVLRGA